MFVNRETTSKEVRSSPSCRTCEWIYSVKLREFRTCEGDFPTKGDRILAISVLTAGRSGTAQRTQSSVMGPQVCAPSAGHTREGVLQRRIAVCHTGHQGWSQTSSTVTACHSSSVQGLGWDPWPVSCTSLGHPVGCSSSHHTQLCPLQLLPILCWLVRQGCAHPSGGS